MANNLSEGELQAIEILNDAKIYEDEYNSNPAAFWPAMEAKYGVGIKQMYEKNKATYEAAKKEGK